MPFYMYKSRYVKADDEQTVYIVPNISEDSVRVYSNCDSVRLSCGKWAETKVKADTTSLFRWTGISLDGDIIKATAYHNGKAVAEDSIALPSYKDWDESMLKPLKGYNYLYNINCGGDSYTDKFGTVWMQDNTKWSKSWGSKFPKEASPYQASQTCNNGLAVSPLFRTSRFGRHELSYSFPPSRATTA